MASTMTRTKELAQIGQATGGSTAADSVNSASSTLSTLKSENLSVPSWHGKAPPDGDQNNQPASQQESASEKASGPEESGSTTPKPEKASTPLTAEDQAALDETVRPYLDEIVYYEPLKSTRSTKAKPSPKPDNVDDADASSADDATPVEGVAESDSPIPTSAPSTSQPLEESLVGKYPYSEFTPIENFEAYLNGAPEMSMKELLHRTCVIQQVLQAYQNEWVEIDKQVYDWEDADKSRAKLLNDEQKAQADLDQADDDAKMVELMSEYKSYLSLSRRDWNDSFTKQYEEQYEEMDEETEAKARATLVLLNRLRDPFYMKGFHRRQKALQSQKWDAKLVEKPEPESKQTKEERDLDERKRKFLTDRITFDDMLRADAYGYTYNAMDLSRGDQRLPNLRVVAKSKVNKRNGKEAEIDIDLEAPRPKRARKGVVTESGDNSEAASATEEETPLPEKRRGRGQNLKLAEVNAGLTASNEPAKRGAARSYVDDVGSRRQVNGQKSAGRLAGVAPGPAKGKGRAPAKSKLDQMSRAGSESEDEMNDFKRKTREYDELIEPAPKRAKIPITQYSPPLSSQPPQSIGSIASILNSEPISYSLPPLPAPPRQRKRPAASTTTNMPSMSVMTGNPETAENSADDGAGKNKKSRLKTELERKVQSDAMKENWKDPTGKMRMGIERRNRRAGRKKFEQTRITNGGAPNPDVVYKSDDENFSYAYFNETPPAPTPPAPALTPNPPPTGYAIANPMPVTSTTASYPAPPLAAIPRPSFQEPGPPPTLAQAFKPVIAGDAEPPLKKARAKRPRPIKTNSNGSGRVRPSSQTKNGVTTKEESDSDSSVEGPSLYEQFQQIASPTGGIDLGKRKSIPRQTLPTYGTTSEEDVGEGSDFH